jgi:hypothetical protein
MRTQIRRRTAVVIAFLACAAVSVLWVALTMNPDHSAGMALDGSGSGSVNSASVGAGTERSDSAGSDSPDSGASAGSSSTDGSARSQSNGSGTARSGPDSAASGSGSSSSSTGSGSTGSGSTDTVSSGGTTGSGPGGTTHPPGHGTTHAPGTHPGHPGGGKTDPPVDHDGLFVSVGNVGTLYPSVRTMAPVTIVNQRRGDLAVTHVRVTSFGAPGCGRRYLVMDNRSLSRSLVVPGNGGRVNTQVRFGLRSTAPDSCKGKNLKFSVSVQAVSR